MTTPHKKSERLKGTQRLHFAAMAITQVHQLLHSRRHHRRSPWLARSPVGSPGGDMQRAGALINVEQINKAERRERRRTNSRGVIPGDATIPNERPWRSPARWSLTTWRVKFVVGHLLQSRNRLPTSTADEGVLMITVGCPDHLAHFCADLPRTIGPGQRKGPVAGRSSSPGTTDRISARCNTLFVPVHHR